MSRGRMIGWKAVLAAVLCMGVALDEARAQAFRVARAYSLSGSSESAFPVHAVLADFGSPNGPIDGHLDVAAIQQNQVTSLLYGSGDGRFASAGRNTDVNDIPTALAAGDFDEDQRTDLVIGGTSKTLQWYRATEEQMTPFAAMGAAISLVEAPVGVAVGYLNEDTHLDLAVLVDAGSGGVIQVLLGNGDGTFSVFGEPFEAGAGVSSVLVGDFTGDTIADVAVSSAVTNSVTVLRNNGTGFLQSPGTSYAVGLEPVSLAAADINGDARLDILSANRSSDSVSVLLATAAGSFAGAQDYASGGIGSFASGVAVGDFDRDGKADIFVANNRSSDLGILLGDGRGGFSELTAYITDQEPIAALAADLDADGGADGVTLNYGDTTPTVAVLLRRADGRVSAIENVVTPSNPTAIAGGDVDADGRCEWVVGHRAGEVGNSGFLDVYRSPENGGPRSLQQLPVGLPGATATGDVNGDGVLDVVAVNESTNEVVVFPGRSKGGFDPSFARPTEADTSAVRIGDWNRDGRDDIALSRIVAAASPSAEPTGAVEIRLSTPEGLSAATTVAVAAQANDLGVGDFNEDGKLDLFVVSSSTVGSLLLLGDGNGAFAAAGPPLTGTNLAQAVAIADYDRDGHDDIALLSAGSDRKVVVSFGDGSGAFPARRDAGTFDGPAAVAARDVTGDGIPDLIVADQASSNSVWVARSQGSQRRFSLTSYGVSRQPMGLVAGDFDGDGRYDIGALTTFVASVAVLSNDSMAFVVRGDGNSDAIVSAADLTALRLDLAEAGLRRIEDVGRGSYAAGRGLDANGDGNADGLDTLALAHRLFQ